jgi:hypothetical protein
MKFPQFFLLAIVLISKAWSLEPYQGHDYDVEDWRCGAPLVQSLRQYDPVHLLNDPAGKLKLKESLEHISERNLSHMHKILGQLSPKEQALVDLIQEKFQPPIVHRTSLESSKVILNNGEGMESSTKRDAVARVTPNIEQELFSGRDCIFTAVGPPYGIEDYGTVILRFKDQTGFAWGSIYTGYSWTLEVAKKAVTGHADDSMRNRFSEQIFTNNHWNEALALQIITHIRAGTTLRGKGLAYDKKTILNQLLNERSDTHFWNTVKQHRLAYLEGHFSDNVPVNQFLFVQFRTKDGPVVATWGLPPAWLTDDPMAFIQYFNREL